MRKLADASGRLVVGLCTCVGAVAAVVSVPSPVAHWFVTQLPSLWWIQVPSSLTWASTVVLILLAALLGFLLGRRKPTPRPKRVPDPNKLPEKDLNTLRVIAVGGKKVSLPILETVLQLPTYSLLASISRLRDLGLVEVYSEMYYLTKVGIEYADKHDLHTLPVDSE